MRSERNTTQLDNPNNPELDNRPRWRVIKPKSVNLARYRQCDGAETKIGQIGIEVDSQTDYAGECQRQIEFPGGSRYWYYPCRLVKPSGERIVSAK